MTISRAALWRLHRERNRIPPRFDLLPVQVGLAGDPWRVLIATQIDTASTL